MAAQGSSIERLAKASIQAKIGILAGALLFLGGIYYYFFYSDMVTERDQLATVRSRQISEEQRLVKRQSAYRDLLKQKADVEERLKKNSIKLPETAELPAFFQHLESQAATANVRILKREIDKEVPIDTYTKVPVKMEISGDFYQINNFFKLLAETSRIITVENLNIGDAKRDGSSLRLSAKFVASTFRQSDRAAAGPRPANQAPPDRNAASPPTQAPATPPPAPTQPPASAPAAPPAAPPAEGKK
jgi:type IV pilus assembly protein PilO